MARQHRHASEALERLIDFANLDLTSPGRRRWKFLELDIWRFFGKVWPKGEWTITQDAIRELQQEAQETIEKVLAARATARTSSPRVVLEVAADDIQTVAFGIDKAGAVQMLPRAESLLTAFLLRMGVVLTGPDARGIRRCVAPDCQKVFWGWHGAQRHCSLTCKNREAGQRFRKKQAKSPRNPARGQRCTAPR
jgi:hypothetical protein